MDQRTASAVDEPIERFPDEVCIAFEELRSVIVSLDVLGEELGVLGLVEPAERLDEIIGAMLRWISRLLRDLDDD